DIVDRFGFRLPVVCFDIDFDAALPFMTMAKTYTPLPKYPPVLRDLAFVVEKKQLYGDIVSAMRNIDPLITHVELFDVFENAKLGKEKQSLAFHISYQSPQRTLRTDEVDSIHTNVIEMMRETFGAEIRS
ncbi:MAG: hypothetical protein Q7R79_00395, partial [bacterium]|nr:hypothetical protein [bacterium]